MALALLGHELVSGNLSGAGTFGLTIPEGTKAIVLVGVEEDRTEYGPTFEALPTIGGLTFDGKYNNDRFACIADISDREDDDLYVDVTESDAHTVVAYYLSGNTLTHWESSTASGYATCTAPTNGGNVFGVYTEQGYSGGAGTPHDYEDYVVAFTQGSGGIGHADVGGADEAIDTGTTRTYFLYGQFYQCFFYEADPTAIIEPAALGFEWGVVDPGPSVTVSDDITNYAVILGMEWGVVLPGPKVRPAGPRQVMLTGEGIKTPEMTVPGTVGQVLAIDSTGTPVFTDPTGGGDITSDPAWTAAGDLIVGDGDDSASILPAGDEDDVLTIVSGVPAWAPPVAGSGDVGSDVIWDAAGDMVVADAANSAVRLPVGDEGDVLTVASGVPAWEPPAAGSTPPALRVYLYSTFK